MENLLADGIYWVGVHFPNPPPGFSLNSFLIRDKRIAVIDTGAPATASMLVANIRNLVDPAKIDYVILTHADMDHAGGLKQLMGVAPQAKVVASEYEAKTLGLWGVQTPTQVVKDGDTISLGLRNLRFVSLPHICTPGSILVFDETDRVLFSADLFALVGPQEWHMYAQGNQLETLKMAQNMKLGNTDYVRKALARVIDLCPEIVASGHGQAIRGDIAGIASALMEGYKS